MLSSGDSVRRVIFTTSLEALCSLEGEEFVACCFQVLLHRQPTDAEVTTFLESIGNGVSKILLVEKLAGSEEGKAVAAVMPGLKRAVKRFRKSQLPIVGWLFRIAYAVQNRRKRLMQAGRVIRLSPRAGEILNRIELEAEKYRSRKEAD